MPGITVLFSVLPSFVLRVEVLSAVFLSSDFGRGEEGKGDGCATQALFHVARRMVYGSEIDQSFDGIEWPASFKL